jgi:hypothetical protein
MDSSLPQKSIIYMTFQELFDQQSDPSSKKTVYHVYFDKPRRANIGKIRFHEENPVSLGGRFSYKQYKLSDVITDEVIFEALKPNIHPDDNISDEQLRAAIKEGNITLKKDQFDPFFTNKY